MLAPAHMIPAIQQAMSGGTQSSSGPLALPPPVPQPQPQTAPTVHSNNMIVVQDAIGEYDIKFIGDEDFNEVNKPFGRQFKIVGFRWLTEADIS